MVTPSRFRSLTLGLPLLVLIAGTCFIGFVGAYQYWLAVRAIERAGVVDARDLLHGVQTYVENEIGHESQQHISDLISRLGVHAEVRSIAVIDDTGMVYAATRYAWIGRPATEVIEGFDASLLAAARGDWRERIVVAAGGERIEASMPVSLGVLPGAVRADRMGVVWLDYDLTGPRAMLWRDLVRGSGALWAATLLATVALIVIIRRLVSRPLRSLAGAAERLAQGDYSAVLPQPAASELALVAEAFATMRRRIGETLAALREREEDLAVTLHSIGDAVIATDTQARVTLLNPIAEKLTGWPDAEARGRPLAEVFPIVHAITRAPAVDPVARVLATGAIACLANHTVLIARDGREYQIADAAAPITDGGGKIRGVVLIFRDVTAEYATAQALKRQRDLYGALSEINQMIVREGDGQRMFAKTCDILVRHAGFVRACIKTVTPDGQALIRAESAGQSWREVEGDDVVNLDRADSPLVTALRENRSVVLDTLPDDAVAEDWQRAARMAGVGGCASLPIRRGGRPYGVLKTYAAVPGYFTTDLVQLLEEVATDLSFALDNLDRDVARQQAEAALRESEDRFRTIADRAPILMWMDSSESPGYGTYYNKAWLEFTGRSLSDECGTVWEAGLHPDDRQSFLDDYRAAYQQRRDFSSAPYRLRRADGAWRWIVDHAVPRFDPAGRFIGFLGIARDVTEERRAAEQAERNAQGQQVLHALLALPIHTHTLPEILGDALDVILETPWLGLHRRGGIFLGDAAQERLTLTAERNLSAGVRAACAQVDFGRCLCGRAAAERVIQHAADVDARHETTYDGIAPHGHYNVPLLLHDRVYGVLVLYVDTGHEATAEELAFLETVGSTLAGIIERKRSIEALHMTAEAVTTEIGERFLERMAWAVCKVLELDGCMIGRRSGAENRIENVAVCMDGRIMAPFAYELPGTPCEQVMNNGELYLAGDVASRFPEFRMVLEFGMHSYLGVQLRDAAGRVLGLLIGMCRRRYDSHFGQMTLLRIFAARAAQELERLRQVADLRIAAHAFETLEGIFITDADGTIVRVNTALVAMTGYSAGEMTGKNPRLFKSGRHEPGFYAGFWKALIEDGCWQGEIWNRRKNGEIFPLWLSVTAVKDEGGRTSQYVASMLDLTERKAAEARIERLAYYDELTGLANRRLLNSRIGQALALAQRSHFCGALMFVDLDHFKTINDALGHAIGDSLLEQVAQRLQLHLRLEDTVARLGGDEFVILLANLGASATAAAAQARVVAEKIRNTLNGPYDLAGHVHHISPSIGITLFPEEVRDADELLKRADTAMYRAKAEGRNCFAFYEPAMQANAERRLAMEKDLRQALVADELSVVCQPQVDAAGRVVGGEVLLRWRHPQRGLVSPVEFIGIAEESGLIVVMGEWTLDAALRQFCGLLAANPGCNLRLSVNVSVRQFAQADVTERIVAIADIVGVDPARLTIEFTEGIFIENVTDTVRKMEALKAHGVRFSIDDFGTGYSSLTYLKRLPIDEIKIDKSFVTDVTVDPDDAAIVETILSVARHLDLHVVAEGVETAEQWAFLKERGCATFQGFHFSKPVSFEEFGKQIGADGLGAGA
jgi:diguanylate cyclase (GGDEF)-like protein/PAS domain S-box-containing protein